MPAENNPTDPLTEVIADHTWRTTTRPDRTTLCGCGTDVHVPEGVIPRIAHAAHVANAIREALGLEQEWALHRTMDESWCYPDGDTYETLGDAQNALYDGSGYLRHRRRHHPEYLSDGDYQVISRWRTGWQFTTPQQD